MSFNLITILGPTAVGKTALAAKLAYRFDGEIISADSRQVYIGLDLGSGKDLTDYTVKGRKIPYHLIDIIEPSEEFNLYLFHKLFYESFLSITSKGKTPFLVGGTGLYLDSILRSYKLARADLEGDRYYELNQLNISELQDLLKSVNPDLHNTTDLLIKERIIKAIIISEQRYSEITVNKAKIVSLNLGIKLPREKIKSNITSRLKKRLDEGMIDEVEGLLKGGVSYNKLINLGLEYRYITMHLNGELNYNDMFQKLSSAIHNFAKRQMTWFRKMEREGVKIYWMDGANETGAENIIEKKFFGSS